MRPEHPDARRSKGCKGVTRAGLLTWRRIRWPSKSRALMPATRDLLLTVARPRGILTRFPILPTYTVRQGTRTLLAEKNREQNGSSLLLARRTLSQVEGKIKSGQHEA